MNKWLEIEKDGEKYVIPTGFNIHPVYGAWTGQGRRVRFPFTVLGSPSPEDCERAERAMDEKIRVALADAANG